MQKTRFRPAPVSSIESPLPEHSGEVTEYQDLFATMLEGIELARAAAHYADEIQAEDITVLDLRGLSQLTDFFVICSASSQPHLKAVRREIVRHLDENDDTRPNSSDGSAESQWLVLDYIDVIVHIFHRDKRDVYAIEDLWSDAERADFERAPAGKEAES